MTTSEVARICNVTTYTVRRWITQGKIKAVKLGNGPSANHRIRRDEFEAFMQQRGR